MGLSRILFYGNERYRSEVREASSDAKQTIIVKIVCRLELPRHLCTLKLNYNLLNFNLYIADMSWSKKEVVYRRAFWLTLRVKIAIVRPTKN